MFVAVADKDYGRTVPFYFLEEVKKAYFQQKAAPVAEPPEDILRKTIVKYLPQHAAALESGDKMKSIQVALSDVVSTTKTNIGVLSRLCVFVVWWC